MSQVGVEIKEQKDKLMMESREIRRSMNQNKSLIEAARLKKKAEEDDKVIKKQVEEIRNNSLHRRSLNPNTSSRFISGVPSNA